MSRKVFSIDSASDAHDAGKLILEGYGGYVLVENNNTVIGIITCRDFVKGIIKWQAAPSEIKVRDMMSTPVHMIHPDATVEEALTLMSRMRIRRLPVLSEENIIGIMVAPDKAKLAASMNPAEISHPKIVENLDVIMT